MRLNVLNMNRGQQYPSPVAFHNNDGVFVGHDGSAWLYRILPLLPLTWEDQPARDSEAVMLHHLLSELTGLSTVSKLPGTKVGANYRQFHLLRLAWDEMVECEGDDPLTNFQRGILSRFSVTDGLVAIGVNLRLRTLPNSGGLKTRLRTLVRQSMDDSPDPSLWAADRSRVAAVLSRAGGVPPTQEQAMRMESWWNGGRGCDTVIAPEPNGRSVSTQAWPQGLEMSALIEAEESEYDPQQGMWMADALTHEDGCVAVSVRGSLVPAAAARPLMRRAQRKAIDRVEEQAATGDLEREEDSNLFDAARELESLFLNGEGLVRDASIVFARRANPADSTFADELYSRWGWQVKVVEHRQMPALEETLPCSPSRLATARPFTQDLTIGVIATSGVRSFSKVGDPSGLWMGLAKDDMTPVWLDPMGSATADKPPAMAVIGEPGSGKTFLLQLIATQATLAGLPVVMVNPKPADDLSGFARQVGGEVITISSTADSNGLLDPFRFASPLRAASIAARHILTVLIEGSEEDEVMLERGLTLAADQGARCVGEALMHPDIPDPFRQRVLAQAQASPLFALGISHDIRPMGGLVGNHGRLTLVQFDRGLDLPPKVGQLQEYPRAQRASIAVIRLVAQAALEQMFTAGGGVMILDEAHVFLSSAEGLQILQRLGREGRSQRILPILATQRIADVVAGGADMGSYLGRVMVMRMTDPPEVEAALSVCGLENAEHRYDFLRHAGPDRNTGRSAHGLLRSLSGQCSAVMVGPIPQELRTVWSTNPLDRAAATTEQNRPAAVLAGTGGAL